MVPGRGVPPRPTGAGRGSLRDGGARARTDSRARAAAGRGGRTRADPAGMDGQTSEGAPPRGGPAIPLPSVSGRTERVREEDHQPMHWAERLAMPAHGPRGLPDLPRSCRACRDPSCCDCVLPAVDCPSLNMSAFFSPPMVTLGSCWGHQVPRVSCAYPPSSGSRDERSPDQSPEIGAAAKLEVVNPGQREIF